MELRVVELEAMERAIALLATLDRSQFTDEQKQIIVDGIQAVAIAEEYRAKVNKRNSAFLREKRKEIPGYNYPKTQPSGRRPGRPRKEETGAE